ncbi:putative endosome-associated ubiquitin isopeptidase (AmsH) [Aspergillus glaucus CBS 516.65]|uniref:MPN domain-containing protein n=1 Tax=Aspergillus glaucus CBS 516.65 TaxID=1160497 RepID=A0A1L9V743_ASPGL|nr:hypothetical protein ASPGLDRAFT_69878 [Aspergillus glaucus CBS 516.65]OJJ79744.1 hypothetical protein ASPGLDRAFT_69878 [Aspergillus glaucus CBS 516.65]
MGLTPPQSVEKITRRAQDYEYNPHISLRNWLRTATTLVREARIYEREGNDEQAYLLLFRHAQLVLVNLSKHPDSKQEKNRKALLDAETEVKASIEKLETLKPRVNKRYERYVQLMRERKARRQPPITTSPPQDPTRHDPALAGVAAPLEAGENKGFAVELARTEISRRATARKALREAGVSEEEERIRRSAGLWGDWESALEKDGQKTTDKNDLSTRIQEVRLNVDQTQKERYTKPAPRQQTISSPVSAYKYPSVPRQQPLGTITSPPIVPVKTQTRVDPPALPPKHVENYGPALVDNSPPHPNKISPTAVSETTPSLLPPALPEKVRPEDDTKSRSDLDPSSFTFKPSAYLENGTPLRTVFLPPDLRTQFLILAASNTRRNLETCGILCGTLISNALFVSRLLVPEQTSTSDTCETVNESAIFDYCDSEDLMVLGWIHTHPTQTCFMSSRDLHTHCGYQVMLPESIAIVCAPSQTPDWGIFRLTDPPGLKTVLNCTQPGLFHPHSETNIYTDALRPGHVFEAKGLEFETVDLRPESRI